MGRSTSPKLEAATEYFPTLLFLIFFALSWDLFGVARLGRGASPLKARNSPTNRVGQGRLVPWAVSVQRVKTY